MAILSLSSARRTEGLPLRVLAREIEGASLEGDGDVEVRGIRHDSREVEPGDLFGALSGGRSEGLAFAAPAAERGASAILCEEGRAIPAGLSLPVLRVPRAREGFAVAASAVYGHPSFALDVVGVTGTNGKTTTTHLIRAAVDAVAGASACGLIGTVGHQLGADRIEAAHTTPEADEIARIMAVMRARAATHVAMEVSSIALDAARVHGVRFRVAAFTNLTQDHLDVHGTMDRYGEAKAKLFLACDPGSAVIHVDDRFGAELARRVRCPLVRVRTEIGATDAEIHPVAFEFSERGLVADVATPAGRLELRSPLVGRHNLENLLVALGCAWALELDVHAVAAALAAEHGAPGRLEPCHEAGDDVVVLVDYAHTPDALARVLDAVRAVARGRVVCAFGCGGDRDPMKRGPMGLSVGERADVAIVTSDNPRTEVPEAIAAPVAKGVAAGGLTPIDLAAYAAGARGVLVELDRARAIASAIEGARPGDVVLIAGKGHEDYQIVGTTKRHFSDVEHAREALAARRSRREEPR